MRARDGVVGFWRKAYEENITGLSGMVAYNLLLSIFPFALVVLFIAGRVFRSEVRPVEVDTTMCLLWDELKHVPCVDVPLEHGDRLVFYTDGITDRVAKDGDMFEMDRLCRVLGRVGHGHPEQIVASLLAEIEAFAGPQEPDDDQTLLVVGID